jgi:hypothetical protein
LFEKFNRKKMKIIAHRGNLHGPDHASENTLAQISKVLDETAFDIELDVWYLEESNEYYLGHDAPQYKLDTVELLNNPRFWIHAKNVPAAAALLRIYKDKLTDNPNIFFHENDQVTLTHPTSYLWTYPGCKLMGDLSIAVMPENDSNCQEQELKRCFAICTDYPYKAECLGGACPVS